MYDIFEALLKEKRVSAYRVAHDIGISPTVFSEWKSGKSTPKIDKLTKLADYFNVSTDYLLGRTNEKKPMETFPISFDVFESGLIERGITKNDIEKLSPEQSKLLFDMLEQFIKTFKDKN